VPSIIFFYSGFLEGISRRRLKDTDAAALRLFKNTGVKLVWRAVEGDREESE